MITVIGHKNPDTDSVISALVFAENLKKEGKDARAGIAGDINKETEFVLDFFSQEKPDVVSGEEEGELFLVDHNDLKQSVAKRENIVGVLDHHLLAGISTDKTIFFRVEPIGSTASLIYKLMKEKSLVPDKKTAGLLLCAIISDTLNLTSPTTTNEDTDYHQELSTIAEIDPQEMATKMFEAKSDFSGKDIKEVISGDMKEYDFSGKKIGVGVAETTSLSYFDNNKEKLLSGIKEVKEENNFEHFFFGAVDILKKETRLYFASKEEKEVGEKIFEGAGGDDFMTLAGITSRKKEIAPVLSKYYGGN